MHGIICFFAAVALVDAALSDEVFHQEFLDPYLHST